MAEFIPGEGWPGYTQDDWFFGPPSAPYREGGYGAPAPNPGPLPPPGAPVPGGAPVGGDSGGGNGGGGGGGRGGGGLSLRPVYNFENMPEFKYPTFSAPTMEAALREPGYQFRLQGGADALERSAAARGALRTGGTLKDISEYGQNFATQEYGNVFNRALQGYDREYRGAYDAFAPRVTEWQTRANAEQAAALAAFAREWQVHGGRGGGGSNNFAADLANDPAPGPLTAPPFSWKRGNTDPNIAEWMRQNPNDPWAIP